MAVCELCPRKCKVDRSAGEIGFCGVPERPVIARAAPHFGEEPCISGTRGSGAIFFAGCNLRCVFCQNYDLSRAAVGKEVTVSRLREIILRLQDEGVHNINFVTATHYSDVILQALEGLSLRVPVVWNSSGYESLETLKRLEGAVQIYLPDMKYMDHSLAARYSGASDYPEIAAAAIKEMFRQTGSFHLDEDGMLQRGVLIRHLVLPEQAENSRNVIDWVSDSFSTGEVLFSLMSQYTPMGQLENCPELRYTVSPSLNDELYHYLMNSGIENGFYQDLDSATNDMIPAFDQTGV
jgi:putative pyruvate formate lyase activating enzyme